MAHKAQCALRCRDMPAQSAEVQGRSQFTAADAGSRASTGAMPKELPLEMAREGAAAQGPQVEMANAGQAYRVCTAEWGNQTNQLLLVFARWQEWGGVCVCVCVWWWCVCVWGGGACL